MIHLDTCFLIDLGDPTTEAARRFAGWLNRGEQFSLSVLVWTEYCCGPLSSEKLGWADRLFEHKEPYVASDAAVAARFFNLGGRRRGTVMDCMIAATALRCRARLATSNPGDFRKAVELGLELA